ncbi:MAG TPA: hypothetical protein VEH26_03615 [Chthoniobacterales bacterium]|nr:hypothetical protein [Chthoniobacterales bacterium]
MKKSKKNIKVRDMKPRKDAKGGGGGVSVSGHGPSVSGHGPSVSGKGPTTN